MQSKATVPGKFRVCYCQILASDLAPRSNSGDKKKTGQSGNPLEGSYKQKNVWWKSHVELREICARKGGYCFSCGYLEPLF